MDERSFEEPSTRLSMTDVVATAQPFLTPVSGLLEPLRLGEEAPAGHSRKNVCQWTTLFETLSPPETCFSSKLSETSTNYTMYGRAEFPLLRQRVLHAL